MDAVERGRKLLTIPRILATLVSEWLAKARRLFREDPTSWAVLATNVVPVVVVLWKGWPAATILALYLLECVVVGLYNLPKMVLVGRWVGAVLGAIMTAAFLGVSFTLLAFIITIGQLEGVDLFERFTDPAAMRPIVITVAFYVFSHGWSFFRYFVGEREYEGRSLEKQAEAPWMRVCFVLVTVLGGVVIGVVVASLVQKMTGEFHRLPVLAALPFLLAKLAVDLEMHWSSHGLSGDD